MAQTGASNAPEQTRSTSLDDSPLAPEACVQDRSTYISSAIVPLVGGGIGWLRHGWRLERRM